MDMDNNIIADDIMVSDEENAVEIPKISVVIPIYNVSKYLRKCINSVQNQTLKDIEIICVNDGSTDNSLQIVEELADYDSRIRIIDKPNSGYGNSMNRGFNAAIGEYIGIVESDDFVSPSMFETLYNLSLRGTVDVVKGNFYDYYVDEKGGSPNVVVNMERDMIPDSVKPFTLRQNAQISWGHPSVWTAIYRREFINNNKIRFIEAKGGGWVDNPFFYETLCKAESIMWTKEPLYYYMKSNPNSSSNLQMDPKLPFERMLDNLDVLEANNYNDAPNKRCAYARALMYLTGALQDFDYDKDGDVINEYAKTLMRRLDGEIITEDFNQRDQYKYFTYASPIKALESKGPKVLIYNWLPFDNPWNWGGGVTVYCKNVISEILKSDPSVNIYFISSGFAYAANSKKTFIRKISNIFGDRVHQYEIVNSPVPADQRNLYINPTVALENEGLKKLFGEFMEKYGPFDAVHFNNIEGLSLDVFDLKEQFPDTKFIFSIHNYMPMCATGIYYMRHKHCNCYPGRTGEDCMACTRTDIKNHIAVETYNRGLFGLDPKDCISEKRWIRSFGFERLDEPVTAEHIQDFANTATEKINKNCDDILAVSQRVYDIAAENGFDESKMRVQYIGTKVAARQLGFASAKAVDGIKIVFLGSDINYEEKGYAFLLDTLEKMDEEYASKIDLVMTVKQAEHAEIYSMCKHFRSLKVIQGYTHADLQWIFEGAHLSIVPVLWEDNLPQIAIESVAYGVPVLASTAGGAKELCDSEMFSFECGNSQDMLDKIKHFVDNPDDLGEYWTHHHGLVTMPMHWNELSEIYGISRDKEITISVEDLNYLIKENEFLHKHLSIDGHGIADDSALEDLRNRLRESELKNERMRQEMKDMKGISGKVIFQNEMKDNNDGIGANLFKLTLDDFDFSDFYAEIKFIKINNIDRSYSKTLTISGTIIDFGSGRGLNLHQIDWSGEYNDLHEYIYCYVRGNSVYFFGKQTDQFSGYAYEVQMLTSRAAHDSVRYESLNESFIYKSEIMPSDAINHIE